MKKLVTAIATVTAAVMAVSPVMAATELTVFNSKSEIQTQFEEEASVYSVYNYNIQIRKCYHRSVP